MSEREQDYSSDQDPAPIVATAGASQLGFWVFAAILAAGGAVLFSLLNANRDAINAPQTSFAAPDPASRISSPPPLALPRRLLEPAEESEASAAQQIAAPRPVPQLQYAPPVLPAPQYVPPPPPRFEPAPTATPPPAVVYDARNELPHRAQGAASGGGTERVSAERLTNPSLTVPKGTIIPAVLETALDSTQPGGVRALVQRDVYSFDGTRVLIQRGSRLYGDYEAALAQGQNRAAVVWGRLLRPDGVTIDLDSPVSDPLGRAGIKGKVDGKFWQRFGGAILQSVLDIGVGVATREASDGVIVAIPGSTQNVTQSLSRADIVPTLKVKHGTSVSVFVARDLDFSSVEP